MKRNSIQGSLWLWLYRFLHSRRIRVRGCHQLSDFYDLFSGLPQGSVLAPLLFIIYINDLIPLVKSSLCEILLFADDISLFPSSYGDDKLHFSTLQTALTAVSTWASLWHITFSTSKTATIVFTKKRRSLLPHLPSLILQSKSVQYQPHYKYLGVILEQDGKSNLHCKHIINKLHYHKYNISRLCGRHLRLPPLVVRKLVECIMVTRITYGLPFFHPNLTHIHKINSILSSSLSSSLHLRGHPHHHSISFELNLPSFYTLRDLELIRFHSRILHLPLTHPSRLLFQREQLMLLDDPSQFLISDIYPLFWCKVLQVSDIWQVHLPLPPDRIRVHTRSQIINEWHSDNRGKLLKSLTQLFIYSAYINFFLSFPSHHNSIPSVTYFYINYQTIIYYHHYPLF